MGCSQWTKQNTLFSFFSRDKRYFGSCKEPKKGILFVSLATTHFPFFMLRKFVRVYNLRFATRLLKNIRTYGISFNSYNASMCSIRSYLYSTECRSIRTETVDQDKTYQLRFETLKDRFLKKEISAQQLLSGFSLLIENHKKWDFNRSSLFQAFSLWSNKRYTLLTI